MANPEHLAILKQGVEVWNRWRKQFPSEIPDLSRTDLGGMNLVGIDMTRANLYWTNLGESDLSESNLSGAILSEANLCECRLRTADLTLAFCRETDFTSAVLDCADLLYVRATRATFNDASLKMAELRRADLSDCEMRRANLSDAILYETIFGNTDLADAVGLGCCVHLGPSIVDYRSDIRSGQLPVIFLRACGLSDEAIAVFRSINHATAPLRSCFISYSGRDHVFASQLHSDLRINGVRCWFAPHDIKAGRKLREQIDEAIRIHDRLLLILSDASMNSEWVKTEIANARQREIRENRQMLFPVSLVPYDEVREWKAFDADTGKDSAREIREYFIPDFSNWKDHDSYQQAFQRLLRDLRAEGTASA